MSEDRLMDTMSPQDKHKVIHHLISQIHDQEKERGCGAPEDLIPMLYVLNLTLEALKGRRASNVDLFTSDFPRFPYLYDLTEAIKSFPQPLWGKLLGGTFYKNEPAMAVLTQEGTAQDYLSPLKILIYGRKSNEPQITLRINDKPGYSNPPNLFDVEIVREKHSNEISITTRLEFGDERLPIQFAFFSGNTGKVSILRNFKSLGVANFTWGKAIEPSIPIFDEISSIYLPHRDTPVPNNDISNEVKNLAVMLSAPPIQNLLTKTLARLDR